MGPVGEDPKADQSEGTVAPVSRIDDILKLIDNLFGPDDHGPVPTYIPGYIEAEEGRRHHPYQPYYDRQGNPITNAETAARLLSDAAARRVALDHVGDMTVSTVHLVLNHQYGDGPPLIFETMIYDEERGEWRDEQWRYPTEEEAVEGHRHVVAWLRGEGDEP